MEDIIRVQEQFYVKATSALADHRTRVLKNGDTFAVFDIFGDILPIGLGSQGIFDGATRFLSSSEFRIGTAKPLLLSSNVHENNILLNVDLTNPDMRALDGSQLPRGILHFCRSKALKDRSCYEQIQITNYGGQKVHFEVSLNFLSDYADIFEVRGVKRLRRGKLNSPEISKDGVKLSYMGLDEVRRQTELFFDPPPQKLTGESATYLIVLEPKEEIRLLMTTTCLVEAGKISSIDERRKKHSFAEVLSSVEVQYNDSRNEICQISSNNPQFDRLVRRSMADIIMMVTETPEGPYPYAGIPWFSTVFGRDGLITAMQALWIQPRLARGVLKYLAATQATDLVPSQDAEPGKILHETRRGEMVGLGEVPFQRYYGSIDSTPLFLALAGAYFDVSGDAENILQLWPHIERALDWIQNYGDVDRDGFVEYQRQTNKGLSNQGWKDSEDSVSHADGSLAEGPIALCEVQAYVYQGKIAAARLARVLNKNTVADRLLEEAQNLKEKFNKVFWCDSISSFALALDGRKKPCAVKSSNPGHCLFSGIVEDRYAHAVATSLMSEGLFSGWGIRTLSSQEKRYNPMSYHNGSVWPHDNGIAAAGLSAYGEKDSVLKILDVLFQTSLEVDQNRLPELFCGFRRRPGEGPTLYPVACSPQSWASGAIFMGLSAALGLSIDGNRKRLTFQSPSLPSFIDELSLKNLKVGKESVDLLLSRGNHGVGITFLRKSAGVEILTLH